MGNICYPMVRGRRMRVTRLDGCGNPVLGPESVVVTKGFISVGLTANIQEGEEINVTNANGETCILDQPAPRFNFYGVEVQFCAVNPRLFNLMSGQPVVMNGDDVIGFDMDSDVELDSSGFALELWTGVPSEACAPGSGQSYGYMLLPFVRGGVLGDFSVENAAINFTLTGAVTKKGSGWGVGPYDVVDAAGTPSPLATPVGPSTHLRTFLTTVAPPEDSCDPSALGTLATGADAGTPGEWTPANSYGPQTLAELQASSITADPATAWTAGQYVVLGDGSQAHWDGDSWEAGPANP